MGTVKAVLRRSRKLKDGLHILFYGIILGPEKRPYLIVRRIQSESRLGANDPREHDDNNGKGQSGGNFPSNDALAYHFMIMY
jgi:hypothetical protein